MEEGRARSDLSAGVVPWRREEEATVARCFCPRAMRERRQGGKEVTYAALGP